MAHTHRRIGDILLAKGLIDAERLSQALASQKSSGSRLGDVLAAMEWVSHEDIAKALAEQYEFDYVNAATIEPEGDALKVVSGRWALAKLMLPICKSEGRLKVAISDPINVDDTDELRKKTGLPLDIVVASPDGLRTAIIRAYTMEIEAAPLAKKKGRAPKYDHQADREALICAVDRLNNVAA